MKCIIYVLLSIPDTDTKSYYRKDSEVLAINPAFFADLIRKRQKSIWLLIF